MIPKSEAFKCCVTNVDGEVSEEAESALRESERERERDIRADSLGLCLHRYMIYVLPTVESYVKLQIRMIIA